MAEWQEKPESASVATSFLKLTSMYYKAFIRANYFSHKNTLLCKSNENQQ